MPTRRGYDPVDDEDLRQENNERLRSGYSAIPSEGVERATEDPGEAPQSSEDTPETPRPTQSDAAGPGSMRVRILDVQGQIYSISVTPEMTVRELKTMLVEVAGVEISRQRIIYGGKVRYTHASDALRYEVLWNKMITIDALENTSLRSISVVFFCFVSVNAGIGACLQRQPKLDVTDLTSRHMVVSGGINSVGGHERCTSIGKGDIPTRRDDAAISFHSQRSNTVVD